MDEIDEISSIITIKNRLSNRMEGSFKLYRTENDDLESNFIVKKSVGNDLRSTIDIRVYKDSDVDSIVDIMYRGNSDTEGQIEAIAGNYLNASIEVRPHNQMFGKFELMSAPKVQVGLSPIADATTRNRVDLRTINYGDTRSMLTGKSTDEEFGSFVQFDDFSKSIPDLKFIESAKLRLYYTNISDASKIELHQPNTIWRELGITDANKPHSVEMLSDTFTINTTKRYIEFDVKDIAMRWQNGTLNNYGFIVSTTDDARYTFFTRESDYPPQLVIEYITSQIYSIGRSELESSIFVYGRGKSDISAKLTVDSTVGFEPLESYLYVHRASDFMHNDIVVSMPVSKPDLFSSLTVQKRDFSNLDSTITVGVRSVTEFSSIISASNPDVDSWLTVDRNMSLSSLITIAKPMINELDTDISISKPDINSTISISDHTKANSDLDSMLIIRNGYESLVDSTITVSNRDIDGLLVVRVSDESTMDGIIQVPDKYDIDSVFGYSQPDMSAVLTVKYVSEIEGQINVKDKEYLDAIIDVKNISEMSAVLMVKAFNQIDGDISVNNPDLFGSLSPRVSGENDLSGEMLIKKRNVADLNSYISVRGQGNRNFVIIF